MRSSMCKLLDFSIVYTSEKLLSNFKFDSPYHNRQRSNDILEFGHDMKVSSRDFELRNWMKKGSVSRFCLLLL